MEKISPKKYIETRARTLPVHQCLVSPDWQRSQMASVIVIRSHVTGNFTVGLYLVDLLCLGVKDTYYYFNISTSDFNRLIESLGVDFTVISYELAHNIVYAAHDFAMEFEIPPHKDFATTRFILEEDDETIPIIDILVGDQNGQPHLMINPHGEGRWAIEKLKKHAGEGNYSVSNEHGFL